MKTYTYTDRENQLHTYEIQCLTGSEVLKTRSLWEEIFTEDSPAFTDYYYEKKACNNITFICRLSNHVCDTNQNEIISMVHLTPYEMVVEGNIIPTFYIVGVATKESHRHRGLMSVLLNEAFCYSKKVKSPFIFLMPADPAIYEPFDFSYIYSRPEYIAPAIESPQVYINSFHFQGISVEFWTKNDADDAKKLCELSFFANNHLKKHFDCYLNHSFDYFRTLLFELSSQDGGIYVIYQGNNICGYFMLAKNDTCVFIQEMLLCDRLTSHSDFKVMSTLLPGETGNKKPIIMLKSLDANLNYVNFFKGKKNCVNEIV